VWTIQFKTVVAIVEMSVPCLRVKICTFSFGPPRMKMHYFVAVCHMFICSIHESHIIFDVLVITVQLH